MKIAILLLVLGTSLVSTVKSEQSWRFELLHPKGFRFYLEPNREADEATIVGRIYKPPFEDGASSEYSGRFTGGPNARWWIFTNETADLAPGDSTFFAVANIFDMGERFELRPALDSDYDVPEDAERVHV